MITRQLSAIISHTYCCTIIFKQDFTGLVPRDASVTKVGCTCSLVVGQLFPVLVLNRKVVDMPVIIPRFLCKADSQTSGLGGYTETYMMCEKRNHNHIQTRLKTLPHHVTPSSPH